MAESRTQSLGEEIANALTHGLGLALGIAALPVLVLAAARTHDAWRVVAVSIYGSSLVLLYLASTLYHSLALTRARELFQRLDHAAIYLLIAGTYTPFVLVPLRGPWGWSLFGVIWGLGALGIVFKSTFGARLEAISTTVYLLMGWLVVLGAGALVAHVPAGGIRWLVAGGLLYTAGVVFFVWERLRYSHAIWHLFVLAGSLAHLGAVYVYVARGGG